MSTFTQKILNLRGKIPPVFSVLGLGGIEILCAILVLVNQFDSIWHRRIIVPGVVFGMIIALGVLCLESSWRRKRSENSSKTYLTTLLPYLTNAAFILGYLGHIEAWKNSTLFAQGTYLLTMGIALAIHQKKRKKTIQWEDIFPPS